MKMINPYIFKEFNIDVKRCYKRRGIYICETSSGVKAIKITEYSPEQICIENNIQRFLYNNGFENQNLLSLSVQDKPYVENSKRIYTMSDWSDTSKFDIKDIGDIKRSIQMLGHMHSIGKNYKGGIISVDKVRFKNLGVTYEKRYRENKKLRKKVNNNGRKTEFEILYLQHVEDYMRLQELALELVNKSSYNKLILKAKKELTIAHRNYTNYNIIKEKDNSLKVVGFEKSNIDVQLIDLACIITKIMDENNWDIDLMMTIVDEYIKICPISLSEWEILKGMIIFPDKFSNICNKYCNTRRRWNYNMFNRNLDKILPYKEQYIKTVDKLLKK